MVKEIGSKSVVEERSGQGEVSLQGRKQPWPGSPHPRPRSPEAARHTYKATKQFFHSTPELLPFS